MLNSSPNLPPRSQPGRLPFYYGWVVVAVAFVTMGIGVNIRTAFSLLFPPILDEFGWSRSETAATFSIGFLASTLITPLLGAAMDRLGPRWVIPIGATVVSAGLVLATATTQPWHLFMTLGLMVVGGTVIFSYIGHSMFLPLWFVRRRGLAVGVGFSGVGVGSIVLFPWFQHIIDTAGWRTSCWVMAALLLFIVLPLNLLLQRHKPVDLGLLPDGDAPAQDLPKADGGNDKASPKSSPEVNWTLRQALRCSAFRWIAVGYFCGLVIWYMVQVHQTKYLLDLGIGTEAAAYALGFVGLTGSIGLIGLGYLSDRLGREWAWTAASLGFGGCYAVLIVMDDFPSLWLMYLMVILQGLLGYGLASTFAVIPSDIFQGRSVAKIFGILSIAASLGAAFGPWLGGILRDMAGTYAPAFWIAIALSLVSISCIWMAAPRKGPLRGPFSQS